jgi:hypothetical protein
MPPAPVPALSPPKLALPDCCIAGACACVCAGIIDGASSCVIRRCGGRCCAWIEWKALYTRQRRGGGSGSRKTEKDTGERAEGNGTESEHVLGRRTRFVRKPSVCERVATREAAVGVVREEAQQQVVRGLRERARAAPLVQPVRVRVKTLEVVVLGHVHEAGPFAFCGRV